jgi:hypothetical protein
MREADQDAKAVVDPLIPKTSDSYPSKNPSQLQQTPTQEARQQRDDTYRKVLQKMSGNAMYSKVSVLLPAAGLPMQATKTAIRVLKNI